MDTLTLWLAGDVMTGRGIDQIQAHPVAPLLYERLVRDARETGALVKLEIVPMQLRHLRLVHAKPAARRSLQSLFEIEGRHFNTGGQAQVDGSWHLRW